MISDQFPPIVGGYERQAARLSRELARRGHAVTVLTGRWSSSMLPREVCDGYRIERVSTLRAVFRFPGTRRFGQDIYAAALACRLRTLLPQADIIHAHSMRRGASVALTEAQRFRIPVLVKEPSSGSQNTFLNIEDDPRGVQMRRLLLAELRHVVVLNAEAERQYQSLPFRELTVHRAFNGIDLSGYPQPAPTSPPILLSLSNLRSEKGLEVLLDAFARIRARHGEWILRICGDGPMAAALAAQAERLGIRDAVQFPGATAKPEVELARASLLALPSLAEGMSNTLLEALAVGLPAVASDVGANAEMLRGDVGWIVAAGDPAALAEQLSRAMSDAPERQRRSERARQRVEEYSIVAAAARYEEIYHQMGVDR